ncbi:MAG: hypothetical protein Q7R59_02115 [bacterium]|nr:hypothetical protein [bacterium]
MKKYSDAELIKMTNDAPKPVREAIENIQTAFDVADIGQKHGLHIDQIGTLAELNRNMILGLVNPQEFLQELITTAKIPDKDAREIMTEINQKIFVPLREEMRNGPPTPEATAGHGGMSAEPATPSPKATQGTAQRNVPMPKYFHLENKIHPAPPAVSLRDVLATVTKEVQKPANNGKLLEDHEEPHIEFHKPLPPPLRPAVASGVGGNLPGVILHPPLPRPAVASSGVGPRPPVIPLPQRPPVAPLPPHASPAATQGTAPPKPIAPKTLYSADPYREPIE